MTPTLHRHPDLRFVKMHCIHGCPRHQPLHIVALGHPCLLPTPAFMFIKLFVYQIVFLDYFFWQNLHWFYCYFTGNMAPRATRWTVVTP
jgi:hypothetical protein